MKNRSKKGRKKYSKNLRYKSKKNSYRKKIKSNKKRKSLRKSKKLSKKGGASIPVIAGVTGGIVGTGALIYGIKKYLDNRKNDKEVVIPDIEKVVIPGIENEVVIPDIEKGVKKKDPIVTLDEQREKYKKQREENPKMQAEYDVWSNSDDSVEEDFRLVPRIPTVPRTTSGDNAPIIV